MTEQGEGSWRGVAECKSRRRKGAMGKKYECLIRHLRAAAWHGRRAGCLLAFTT